MLSSHKDASTTELVKEALDEARQLIKLEVALARDDVASELTRARSAAIALAVAALSSNVALAMVLFAVGLASGAGVVFGISAAIVLFVIAGIGGAVAYRTMPRVLLTRTRQRIEIDIQQLGERAHGS